MAEYFCVECGEPCKLKQCNSGIGSYEFWGAKGNDSHPYLGSDCCEADLCDDEGQVIYPELDEADDQADRIADERRERELEFDRGVEP